MHIDLECHWNLARRSWSDHNCDRAAVVHAKERQSDGLSLNEWDVQPRMGCSTKNGMFNQFNEMAVSSPEIVTAVKGLRDTVIDPATDHLVFSYLNCMQTVFSMRQHGLVTKDTEVSVIRNGLGLLERIKKDDLLRYLKRGYDASFRGRLIRELNNAAMQASRP